MQKSNLSVEPYKGTRDFYPEDQFVQNYIFSTWRKVVESYGYREYNASILEETELYRAKSGEEIISEQTYSFTDRGGRDVTMRPEMTPTVARLVAQRRQTLPMPLRWYSVPNLFRYERPQRGRLREHWQLNVDLFGVTDQAADLEVISVATSIMSAFGAKAEDYRVRVSSRKLLNALLFEALQLKEVGAHQLTKLLDRKNKMPAEDFFTAAEAIVGQEIAVLEDYLGASSVSELPERLVSTPAAVELGETISQLKARGIENAEFDPTLVRGFDYYTGVVFEVFDTNPENPRSLFGGGRYDDLVGIFGVESVPAFGFGMGDVTIRDFLETHQLLPTYQSVARLYVGHMEGFAAEAGMLAQELRTQGIPVLLEIMDRKVPAQIKAASRESVPYLVIVGGDEVSSAMFKLKDLSSGEEREVARTELAAAVR